MGIEPLTAADFNWILEHFGDFWDDDSTKARHLPIFLHEFGDTALVIRDEDRVAAYLLGFVAQDGRTGYVHMVAAGRAYRRRGLAHLLYDHFVDLVRARGCTSLKATAAPWNQRSIGFHTAYGMEMQGEDTGAGVPVLPEYSGPGLDRVVFLKKI